MNFALAIFNLDKYVDVAVVDSEFTTLMVVLDLGCRRFERGLRLKFYGQHAFCVHRGFRSRAEKKADRLSIVINEPSN